MDRTAFTLTPVPPIDIPLNIVDAFPSLRHQPDFTTSHLPEWLSVAPAPKDQTALPLHPRTATQLEVEQQVFDSFFERFLDHVTLGDDLLYVIRSDPRGIDPGRFMRWIKKNPDHLNRYEEAQEIATELILARMDQIAEGSESMEDIERSKLRLKQYEFKVKSWNRRRYGDSKQVDINMTAKFDFRARLEEREEQLRTLDGEFRMINE